MTASRLLPLIALLALAGLGANAQEIAASVSQGTNMAVALAPDGQSLVIDLMGRLWSLPVTGGGAQPLGPATDIARNPRFSPDGRQLVYQRYNRGQWDIWMLDLDTLNRRRLSSSRANETQPDFSADGRSVLFVSDQDGGSAIFRLTLESGVRTQLTFDGDAYWPTASERGEIAYVERRGDQWSLRVLPGFPPALTVYTSRNALSGPSWRPGGGVLTFTERSEGQFSNLRMAVIADVEAVKTLTRGEDVFGFRAAWRTPGELLYTADGRIWQRGIGSTERSAVPLFAGVGIMPAPRDLRTSVAPPTEPAPALGIRAPRTSPSGREVAFTALGDLWLWTADGDLRQLTDDAYVDIDPTFSPDGRTVVFASDRAGSMDLWSLDPDSGDVSRLTNEPIKSFDPAVSPDGRSIAYLATAGFGPWDPAEVRIVDISGKGLPRTLARGLRDAGDVAWTDDGAGVRLWARNPEATRSDRMRLTIDIASGQLSWNDTPADSGRELLVTGDLPELDWTPADGGGRYVIQVDRLFDGIGTQYRRYVDIHVEGTEIVAVVGRGVLPLPRTVIDAREYTIMPGMIDLHAHQSSLAGERLGRAWLAYGVTTVREIGSQRDDGLERREAWASGRRIGPRLLLSARHGNDSGWPAPGDAPPTYDVLQLYRGQPVEMGRALVQEARRFGVPVFGDSLLPSLPFGVNAIEHIGTRGISEYDLERSGLGRSYADVVELLRHSGAAVTPTLAALGGFGEIAARSRGYLDGPVPRQLFSPAELDRWRGRSDDATADGLQATLAMLARAGVRLTAGSDAPTVPYGLGLQAEISLLARTGMSNDQALRLATSDAALVLGLERQIGSIEAGKLADLVVVAGNPLESIGDIGNIVAVVHGGVWHDRDALLRPPPRR